MGLTTGQRRAVTKTIATRYKRASKAEKGGIVARIFQLSWSVSDRPVGEGRPSNSWVVAPLEDGADSRWTVFYTEKGIDGRHVYFDTEDDACQWAAKIIEKDAAMARAPVCVRTAEERAKSAEVRKKFLEKMNIPDWREMDLFCRRSC